jgi:prepilin-type processing-associated H-X9-DG protein
MGHFRTAAQNRRGVSLVETLVVAGVFGLMIALASPALHSARERARAMQCRSHLKQLALGVNNFETQHGILPLMGMAHDEDTASSLSIWFQLLAHLEQSGLTEGVTYGSGLLFDPPVLASRPELMQMHVSVLTCPSDSLGTKGTNYRACAGAATWDVYRENQTHGSRRGVLLAKQTSGRRAHAQWKWVTDGLSNTIMLSERVQGDRDPDVYSPERDVLYVVPPEDEENTDVFVRVCQTAVAPVSPPRHYTNVGLGWMYQGYGHTWYNHALPPNAAIPDCSPSALSNSGVITARSRHPGGVHAALADGSVRFVNESIDLALWRALSTRAGNEPVGEF